MKNYRIVQKLDNKGVFYYIVQQRKYLFFWGLPREVSLIKLLADDGDGLYAPQDYSYKKFRLDELPDLKRQIYRIQDKKITNKHHKVTEYL